MAPKAKANKPERKPSKPPNALTERDLNKLQKVLKDQDGKNGEIGKAAVGNSIAGRTRPKAGSVPPESAGGGSQAGRKSSAGGKKPSTGGATPPASGGKPSSGGKKPEGVKKPSGKSPQKNSKSPPPAGKTPPKAGKTSSNGGAKKLNEGDDEAAQKQIDAQLAQEAAAANPAGSSGGRTANSNRSTTPSRSKSSSLAAARSPIRKKTIRGVANRRKVRRDNFADMAAQIAEETWPTVPSGSQAGGFYNPANNCYRNTAYHTLFSMPEVLDIIQEHKKSHHNEDKEEEDLCLTCQLQNLQGMYWKTKVLTITKTQLTDFSAWLRGFDARLRKAARKPKIKDEDVDSNRSVDIIEFADFDDFLARNKWRRCPSFQGLKDASQHDNPEFFQWMMEKMTFHNTELNDEQRNRLEGLFPLLNSYRLCPKCGRRHTNAANREFPIKPLDVAWDRHGKDAYGNALKWYMDENWFHERVKDMRCANPDCELGQGGDVSGNPHEKLYNFVEAPTYIILQLNVFNKFKKRREMTKAGRMVKLPLWLDLSEYAAEGKEDLAKDGALRFKLMSTTTHKGDTVHAGHYWGTYTGPMGIRRLNDLKVHYACASHLRWPYKLYGEVATSGKSSMEWADEQLAKEHKKIDRQNEDEHKETAKAFKLDADFEEMEDDGDDDVPSPYLVVYKRLGVDSETMKKNMGEFEKPEETEEPEEAEEAEEAE